MDPNIEFSETDKSLKPELRSIQRSLCLCGTVLASLFPTPEVAGSNTKYFVTEFSENSLGETEMSGSTSWS